MRRATKTMAMSEVAIDQDRTDNNNNNIHSRQQLGKKKFSGVTPKA
jgi:hypothetical protein